MSEPKSIIPPSLVPPGVSDDRQHALAQLFGEMLGGIDLSTLLTSDPMTVDARLLPFLTRELAAQEFVDPDFPEHVQRRILANIWELKSLHGYDAGVRLGLSLLGMRMIIRHWHQQVPPGPANTHEITFLVGEALFDENALIGPRTISAASRMIDATKRWSQESAIRVGVNVERAAGVTSVASSLGVSRQEGTAVRPTGFAGRTGLATAAAPISVFRPRGLASRPSSFSGAISVTASAAIIQINRFAAQAA